MGPKWDWEGPLGTSGVMDEASDQGSQPSTPSPVSEEAADEAGSGQHISSSGASGLGSKTSAQAKCSTPTGRPAQKRLNCRSVYESVPVAEGDGNGSGRGSGEGTARPRRLSLDVPAEGNSSPPNNTSPTQPEPQSPSQVDVIPTSPPGQPKTPHTPKTVHTPSTPSSALRPSKAPTPRHETPKVRRQVSDEFGPDAWALWRSFLSPAPVSVLTEVINAKELALGEPAWAFRQLDANTAFLMLYGGFSNSLHAGMAYPDGIRTHSYPGGLLLADTMDIADVNALTYVVDANDSTFLDSRIWDGRRGPWDELPSSGEGYRPVGLWKPVLDPGNRNRLLRAAYMPNARKLMQAGGPAALVSSEQPILLRHRCKNAQPVSCAIWDLIVHEDSEAKRKLPFFKNLMIVTYSWYDNDEKASWEISKWQRVRPSAREGVHLAVTATGSYQSALKKQYGENVTPREKVSKSSIFCHRSRLRKDPENDVPRERPGGKRPPFMQEASVLRAAANHKDIIFCTDLISDDEAGKGWMVGLRAPTAGDDLRRTAFVSSDVLFQSALHCDTLVSFPSGSSNMAGRVS